MGSTSRNLNEWGSGSIIPRGGGGGPATLGGRAVLLVGEAGLDGMVRGLGGDAGLGDHLSSGQQGLQLGHDVLDVVHLRPVP